MSIVYSFSACLSMVFLKIFYNYILWLKSLKYTYNQGNSYRGITGFKIYNNKNFKNILIILFALLHKLIMKTKKEEL